MIRPFGKVGLLCLALVLAVGGLGIGYASWSDVLYINSTVITDTVEVEFQGPYIQLDAGPDWTCDVGITNVRLTAPPIDTAQTTITNPAPDTLEIVVEHAYPSYCNHIYFDIHNSGTVPICIQEVRITFDGDTRTLTAVGLETWDDMFELYWGNNFGPTPLNPCGTFDMSFEFHFLQDGLEQGATYYFTIEIDVVQWNMYVGP